MSRIHRLSKVLITEAKQYNINLLPIIFYIINKLQYQNTFYDAIHHHSYKV